MENKEILERAINKALDGGWNPSFSNNKTGDEEVELRWKEILIEDRERYRQLLLGAFMANPHQIFIKEFCQGIWGDELTPTGRKLYVGPNTKDDKATSIMEEQEAWMHHMQQMVISEDPFKYLKRYL